MGQGEIKDVIVKDSVSLHMIRAGNRNCGVRLAEGFRAGMLARAIMVIAVLASLPVISGCRLEMYDQARYEPLEMSTFFPDSQSARPQVKGTVPRTHGFTPDAAYGESSGGLMLGADSGIAARISNPDFGEFDRDGNVPVPVTHQFLVRGKERFDIYCSPCHGSLGDGQGMIVQRGFPVPTSFHTDRLRQVPDGYFYDVITNGFGVMYSYASRIPPDDRWAIAAYIRALQLSQHMPVQDLPAQERTKLQGSGE